MIEERIDLIMQEFATKVNEAIINDEFKVIKRDAHTITIEVLGEEVEMWDANEADSTTCYRINFGNMRDWYFEDCSFKKPATCRKKLRHETEDEKAIRKDAIKKQISNLEKELA